MLGTQALHSEHSDNESALQAANELRATIARCSLDGNARDRMLKSVNVQ